MTMNNINWYPGHMKKTKELISNNIKLVDMVLEIVDARVPLCSKNPDIKTLAKNKKRIILLNKSDLVERSEVTFWRKYFLENNYADDVLDISAETGYNINKLFETIDFHMKEKRERLMAKGLIKVIGRVMIAGIPNVGKSRLINRVAGRSAAGVANTPGFTKGKQWVKLKDTVEMLDTPGILWPKFEDETVGLHLAITGAIKDTILDTMYVAVHFLKILFKKRKEAILKEKYKLTDEDLKLIPELLIEKIGLNLGYLLKENKVDAVKAAGTLLRDYRSGKLGKFGIDDVLISK